MPLTCRLLDFGKVDTVSKGRHDLGRASGLHVLREGVFFEGIETASFRAEVATGADVSDGVAKVWDSK